jgi:TatD DNase family protein
MIELIDTHVHLYAEEYSADQSLLIENAISSGVKQFLLPNIDHTSFDGLQKLVEDYPGVCIPMMGLHPCYVKSDYKSELEKIESLLRKEKYCAIGEIGMDKYWELDFIAQQEEALRFQLILAYELKLPVALHTRNATEEVIAIIKDLKLSGLTGVFHCYSGDLEQAMRVIDLGFYLGIGGVLTFKNSGLDKVVEGISLNHLLLETDGPYLAPVPHRGKRNEPAYLRLVAEKLATLKNISLEEVASVTSANAKKLFRL